MIKMHSKNKKGVNKMKKNLLLVLLLGVLVLGLTGCGSGPKAKITNLLTGKQEEYTSSELINLSKDNEVSFKSAYSGAKIEITGKVKEISDQSTYICVFLENNWVLHYSRPVFKGSDDIFTPVASTLNKGDTIRFVGKLFKVGGYCANSSTVEINVPSDFKLDVVSK